MKKKREKDRLIRPLKEKIDEKGTERITKEKKEKVEKKDEDEERKKEKKIVKVSLRKRKLMKNELEK